MEWQPLSHSSSMCAGNVTLCSPLFRKQPPDGPVCPDLQVKWPLDQLFCPLFNKRIIYWWVISPWGLQVLRSVGELLCCMYCYGLIHLWLALVQTWYQSWWVWNRVYMYIYSCALSLQRKYLVDLCSSHCMLSSECASSRFVSHHTCCVCWTGFAAGEWMCM